MFTASERGQAAVQREAEHDGRDEGDEHRRGRRPWPQSVQVRVGHVRGQEDELGGRHARGREPAAPAGELDRERVAMPRRVLCEQPARALADHPGEVEHGDEQRQRDGERRRVEQRRERGADAAVQQRLEGRRGRAGARRVEHRDEQDRAEDRRPEAQRRIDRRGRRRGQRDDEDEADARRHGDRDVERAQRGERRRDDEVRQRAEREP